MSVLSVTNDIDKILSVASTAFNTVESALAQSESKLQTAVAVAGDIIAALPAAIEGPAVDITAEVASIIAAIQSIKSKSAAPAPAAH